MSPFLSMLSWSTSHAQDSASPWGLMPGGRLCTCRMEAGWGQGLLSCVRHPTRVPAASPGEI